MTNKEIAREILARFEKGRSEPLSTAEAQFLLHTIASHLGAKDVPLQDCQAELRRAQTEIESLRDQVLESAGRIVKAEAEIEKFRDEFREMQLDLATAEHSADTIEERADALATEAERLEAENESIKSPHSWKSRRVALQNHVTVLQAKLTERNFEIENLKAKNHQAELLLSAEDSETYQRGHNIPTHKELTALVAEQKEMLDYFRKYQEQHVCQPESDAWDTSCQDGHQLIAWKSGGTWACPICDLKAEVSLLKAELEPKEPKP